MCRPSTSIHNIKHKYVVYFFLFTCWKMVRKKKVKNKVKRKSCNVLNPPFFHHQPATPFHTSFNIILLLNVCAEMYLFIYFFSEMSINVLYNMEKNKWKVSNWKLLEWFMLVHHHHRHSMYIFTIYPLYYLLLLLFDFIFL